METKPNQSTPGSSASQSTGAGKTAASGSTPQSSTDRNRSSAAASATTPSPQASTDTTPASPTTTARTDARPQDQDQKTSRSQPDAQGVAKSTDGIPQSWMNVSSWLDGTNQIPQSVKDLGTKATDQFNKLTTTQKVVGGALLVSGLSWLALRSKSEPKSRKNDYRSNTDYRSGSSRPYASGTTADQKFQGPYGNSPTRGISDDYPTSSSAADSSYRSSPASTSGFGEDDYSSDL